MRDGKEGKKAGEADWNDWMNDNVDANNADNLNECNILVPLLPPDLTSTMSFLSLPAPTWASSTRATMLVICLCCSEVLPRLTNPAFSKATFVLNLDYSKRCLGTAYDRGVTWLNCQSQAQVLLARRT